jgi:catechol 2,3-dioxygenase-like lactoylglutathione lyase family enzyme
MARRSNTEFTLRGVNHLALVCKDMAQTVDFYANVLGMPLTKTIELPNGMGQHFFFDIGNGDSLAFFWFPDAPAAAPGIASPRANVGEGSLTTAHGSMNHVAFDVPAEKIEEYRDKLLAKGIKVTDIINHDDTPRQVSPTVNESTFVRSIYFFDPNGILLEFAGWTRELGEGDVRHKPATAADKERYLAMATEARRR